MTPDWRTTAISSGHSATGGTVSPSTIGFNVGVADGYILADGEDVGDFEGNELTVGVSLWVADGCPLGEELGLELGALLGLEEGLELGLDVGVALGDELG